MLWAALASALVLLSWLAAVSPVRDKETLRAVAGAQLEFPPAYLVIAPLCDVLDALALLSVRQTIALLLSLAGLYAGWRIVRWRRGGGRWRGAVRELWLGVSALGVVIAVYAIGIFVPRPMAALVMPDPDAVTVDVHSHTNFSHDGRSDFDVRANRAWHRGAGFDVAYITDHRSFAGAAQAMALNPRRAGDGLVVLSGLEFIDHHSTLNHNHLNALGVTARDSAWIRVRAATGRPPSDPSVARARAPVLIQTIPENLSQVPRPDASGRGGVLAIELSDGAPRGIGQGQRDRALILRIADSLDLAVVAGSNNHGWGRTAVAWSVLRIPGWRSLTPEALGQAIEDRIRTKRRRAVQVIERRSPDPGRSRLALAATLPAVVWNLLVTLSPAQRVSWILWAWLLAAAGMVRTARRRRRPATS